MSHANSSSFTGYKRSFTLPIGGEGEACANVLLGKVREITQNLVMTHPGREIIKNVVNRDPQSSDTWLATPLAGFDRDNL